MFTPVAHKELNVNQNANIRFLKNGSHWTRSTPLLVQADWAVFLSSVLVNFSSIFFFLCFCRWFVFFTWAPDLNRLQWMKKWHLLINSMWTHSLWNIALSAFIWSCIHFSGAFSFSLGIEIHAKVWISLWAEKGSFMDLASNVILVRNIGVQCLALVILL